MKDKQNTKEDQDENLDISKYIDYVRKLPSSIEFNKLMEEAIKSGKYTDIEMVD